VISHVAIRPNINDSTPGKGADRLLASRRQRSPRALAAGLGAAGGRQKVSVISLGANDLRTKAYSILPPLRLHSALNFFRSSPCRFLALA
jgi:hypothetical protein